MQKTQYFQIVNLKVQNPSLLTLNFTIIHLTILARIYLLNSLT